MTKESLLGTVFRVNTVESIRSVAKFAIVKTSPSKPGFVRIFNLKDINESSDWGVEEVLDKFNAKVWIIIPKDLSMSKQHALNLIKLEIGL